MYDQHPSLSPVAPFDIQIDGMTCSGCVRRVTDALKNLQGVVVDEVEVGRAAGHFVNDDVGYADLVSAIGKLGFKVHVEAV